MLKKRKNRKERKSSRTRNVMKLDTNQELLYRAVLLLARQCDYAHRRDDVGFNKFDSRLGHLLAETSPEIWTPQQKRSCWKMLRGLPESSGFWADTLLQGCYERMFNRPSPFDSSSQCAYGYANINGPLRERLSVSVMGKPSIAAHVALLFGSCSPSTILRRVTKVVLFSFQRKAGGTSTHVGQKSVIGPQPARTHGYSASAIVFPLWIVVVQTSVFHCSPASIFGTTSITVSFICRDATATTRITTGQTMRAYLFFPTAVTAAKPISRDSAIGHPMKHCPFSEVAFSQIYEIIRVFSSVVISHKSVPPMRSWLEAVSEVRFIDGFVFYSRLRQ